MEVKPGYKQSEAGVIPQDWTESTIGEQFEVQLGKMVDAAKNRGVMKPYLGNAAVKWGRFDLTQLQMVPMSKNDMERYRLLAGDLLVCEGRGVGRSAIWTDELGECYYQKALHRLRARRGFSPQLMVEIFRFWVDQERLTNYVTESTIPHLTKEKLVQIPLGVPSPLEQQNIVQALSDVNNLVESLDRLIAKKRDIKQAAMHQLLTGKTRLPGFSGEWGGVRLGDLGWTYGGLSGKTKADFGTGSSRYIPFLNIMNNIALDPDDLEEVRVGPNERQNQAQKGDLFFNGSSETPDEVGMCSVLLTDVSGVYLNSFCFGFRLQDPARVQGLYLAYFFRSHLGRELLYSLAQGATRYNLSKTNLLKLRFPLPSFKEQSAIAEVLSVMDAEIAALEDRRDKTKLLKEGMMQELLTGRTRLI